MVHATEKDRDGCSVDAERASSSARRYGLPPLLVLFLLLLGLSTASVLANSTPCDCGTCHGDFHGPNWQGCSGCHESPPQTGSHLVHYNSPPIMSLHYGDTAVTSTADAYKFGCGNCHPLDRAKHRDGTLEVELYDALSPSDSLKAKNPPSAAFDIDAKTCSDVYCHSGYTVASSVVGLPLTYPASPIPPGYTLNGSYIMDATCSNLTYAPYTVDYSRAYATTPAWGTTGAFTTCTECHEFPLTTYYPDVFAGVGDSHQWVDNLGWNWRHAYNMGFDPVPCSTCHNSTVTQAGTTHWTTGEGGAPITAYDPVPLSSRVTHVNGNPDVAFDVANGFRYFSSWGIDRTYSLAGASYDPVAKTCSNVSCHYNPGGPIVMWQKEVRWGGPWRDEHESGQECDLCHRYGYLNETCQPAP